MADKGIFSKQAIKFYKGIGKRDKKLDEAFQSVSGTGIRPSQGISSAINPGQKQAVDALKLIFAAQQKKKRKKKSTPPRAGGTRTPTGASSASMGPQR